MIRTIASLVLRDRKSLGLLAVLLSIGILFACLWPFRAPKNSARWIEGSRGIDLGHFGVLLANKPLALPGDPGKASVTIDLWVRPHSKYDYGELLTIYTPQNSRQFNLGQWRTGLTLRSASPGDPARNGGAPCYTPDLFIHGKDVFITITSDAAGTSVYGNGILQKTTPTFHITNRMLNGNLVLGTGASTADTWRGRLYGMAIYDRALDAREVQADRTSWIDRGHPAGDDSQDLLASYRFDEHTGRTIQSTVKGSADLSLPEIFVVPEKDVLERPALDDPTDIIENIIGFMPLGFVMCGYLIASGRRFGAVMVTAILCGVFSLVLELLQVYLPTRDSSMMDVISNFTGGVIGALLYAWIFRDSPSIGNSSLGK